MGPELWATVQAMPGVHEAPELEAAGWDGLTFGDSQCLMGDPYVALTAAALETSRIRLGVGVTNPWTRHPAVTAAAVMSAHMESGRRVALGIGRGDSSLSRLGLAPVPLPQLISYTTAVQTYLRGGQVPVTTARRGAPQVFQDRLVPLPDDSRLTWLAGVPEGSAPEVFLVASGPRTIRAAASTADVTALSVGADRDRLREAAETARETRADVRLAAFVHVVVDDDIDRARAMAIKGITRFARFSHRGSSEPDPRFLDSFAVLGPADYCRDRLLELADIGLERFHVVTGCSGEYRKRSYRAFIRQVAPALREHRRVR
ncbi:LLM class flavin-dependent oxidoreductase [Streptomyces sp. NPDC018029]|uniref:LLM class flavin-dependent oxidoreductase n=1 Tax=Streptomyces sp. NPDC018029 TaxID=3365032 RepID=UPI0037A5B195